MKFQVVKRSASIRQGRKPRAHSKLVKAGWDFQLNPQQGWIIYKNPRTGLWQSRTDAAKALADLDRLMDS